MSHTGSHNAHVIYCGSYKKDLLIICFILMRCSNPKTLLRVWLLEFGEKGAKILKCGKREEKIVEYGKSGAKNSGKW